MTGDRDERDAETKVADVASRGAGAKAGAVFAGRYQVEHELGRGGMGAVYRAVDTMVGDVVALKTLDLGVAPSEAAVERFRREVRLARRISHPNVARTHDLGESGGVHYLTMELVVGKDLEHVLRAGKLAPARAVGIGIGIAEGLAAAHAAGIVHRDLKPANVLIEDGTGRVVLTDFGIARGLAVAPEQSRTVGTVGTPIYMAPEQVRGAEIDARTDVYALGLVLFEMLTGELPFRADTPIAAAVARLDRAPPDPRTLATIDDALATLVLACLAKEPDARPAGATEVAGALRRMGDLGHAATHVHPVSLAPPEPARVPTAPMPATTTPGPATPPRTGQTTSGGYRSLAVLPFRYRGPPGEAYLGDSLTEELVDVLSRTRALRVLASAATARFKDDRDPQEIGTKLGVDALVDGNVQSAGGKLRITARLIDVRTATQLWSERYDAPLEDVFDVQEKLSKRIAEALRVTLEVGANRIDAPPAAIEAYLRGRQALTGGVVAGAGGAYDLFEQALALAPDLAIAKAGIALAAVRAWFIPNADRSRDWPTIAAAAVERALREAPDAAESHIAAAQYGLQTGAYGDAVRQLGKAIDIAPTFGGAQAALGSIEIEAGRVPQGEKRLRLAHELDPSSPFPPADLARSCALRGAWDEARALLATIDARAHPTVLNVRMRLALWQGSREEVAAVHDEAHRSPSPVARFTEIGARAYLDATPVDVLLAQIAAVTPARMSPRFEALFRQVMAEIFLGIGEHAHARRVIAEAAHGGLIDLVWLERCPLLAPVRDTPEVQAAHHEVQNRVAAIWAASV